MIKFCIWCGNEHSNSDEFCSTLCFNLWLGDYTKKLIARIMDSISIPLSEMRTEMRLQMEEEEKERKQ